MGALNDKSVFKWVCAIQYKLIRNANKTYIYSGNHFNLVEIITVFI